MDDEVQFSSCIWVKFGCPCRSAIMSEVSLPPNKSFAHSVSGGSCIWGYLESDVLSYRWTWDQTKWWLTWQIPTDHALLCRSWGTCFRSATSSSHSCWWCRKSCSAIRGGPCCPGAPTLQAQILSGTPWYVTYLFWCLSSQLAGDPLYAGIYSRHWG